MTCLEAQSKIIAYIDNNLEKDEKVDFLKHIQGCKDCKEELDIYYTMIEGMRQLDSNMPLSRDFTQELDARMQRELKYNRKKREFFRSSVCIIIVSVLGFFIFGYVNFLNLLHEDEQAKLKEAQGEYYFSETFEHILFEPYEDENIININVETEQPEQSFYEKIRQHNMLQ
ncbi:MAG: anti-sigma factor family protein [Lachnospiraceae bacterium]